MAWITEYDMTWVGNTNSGNIYIQRDEGSYQQSLKLKRGSLEIRRTLPSYEEPVVRSTCSFIVMNEEDAADWHDFLPLMTISLGQYRVVVSMDATPVDLVLFEGYLNCETVSQDMLQYSELRLTASGLLSKLQHIEPTEITDPVANRSLIDIIDHCLRLTGSVYNIRVMCSLYNSQNPYTGDVTLFNRVGVSTELFWENNEDRKDALYVISEILRPFNCYLYWYQNYWYIDYYEDLGTVSRSYIEYTSGVSYQVNSTGTQQNVNSALMNVYSTTHRQIGNTQVLSVIPGCRQIEIRKEEDKFSNLMNGDLSEMEVGFNPLTVGLREWYGHESPSGDILGVFDEDNTAGLPFKTITSAVQRRSGHVLNSDNWWYGLNTQFNVSAVPGTELTIRWKQAMVIPPLGDSQQWITHNMFFYYPSEMTVKFHWSLRIVSYYGAPDNYFKLDPTVDPSDDAWTMNSSTDPHNYLTVGGDQYDTDRWVYEPQIVVPLGSDELGLVSPGNITDMKLQFVCGITTVECDTYEFYPDPDQAPVLYERIGDFEAVVSGDPEPNSYEGTIVTDFLDEKTITLKLYDTYNWNYRNSLLCNNYGALNYIVKTEAWKDGKAEYEPLGLPIAKLLLSSKFRLYRIARQKLQMDNYRVNVDYQFRPLARWQDLKQAKSFVLASDIHYPDQDKHSLVLFEYDNTEEINLDEE